MALVAAANAGIATYPQGTVIAPTVTSEQQNVLRSYGNLGQISHFSKTIDTPYSSVSKSDVRVSNPGYAVHAAPAVAYHQAPVAYHAQPQVAYHAQPQVAYAPAVHHAAPTVVKSAPAVSLLGVAYSPATSVSHMTYSAPAYTYSW